MPQSSHSELLYQIALTMVLIYILCLIQALGEKPDMDIGMKLNEMDTGSREMTGRYLP